MKKILAIETSCDETAAAVVADGQVALSNSIYSQIDMHKEYGGVVPELASRSHIEKIELVVDKALSDSGLSLDDIDAVAVTYGPGLVGPLLVGVSFAKALVYSMGKPLIAVNHIKGHIAANYITDLCGEKLGGALTPPYLGLVVSGGHTHLLIANDYDDFTILGRTVDDAAGEAFDKIARAIGLGYPGGPKIDNAAKEGNEDAYHFPKAKVEDEEFSFSFSGLKSHVLNFINSSEMSGERISINDLAASFQKAVVDVLCEHLLSAAQKYNIKKAALSGGVASNSALRNAMKKICDENDISLYIPPKTLCTDNAVMIGAAAYHSYLRGEFAGLDLNAEPRLLIND